MDRSFFFPQLAGVGGFPADLSSKQKTGHFREIYRE
jgi:hypothetical protein